MTNLGVFLILFGIVTCFFPSFFSRMKLKNPFILSHEVVPAALYYLFYGLGALQMGIGLIMIGFAPSQDPDAEPISALIYAGVIPLILGVVLLSKLLLALLRAGKASDDPHN